MSDRRDISDVIRTADAQRRETPRTDLWARIDKRLGPAEGQAAPAGEPAAPALNGRARAEARRPTRGELIRRARAERRDEALRRPRRATWWAAAAAALALVVATWAMTGDRDFAPAAADAEASAEPLTTERLELAAEPVVALRVPRGVYDGVVILEGDVAVNELRTCSPPC